jgi:capsule polysaccharide export protein KpsE/RkpR
MSDLTPLERATLATRELRRARARRILITLALWVGCPTLLAAIYYGLLVTPQYESVAVLCVDSGDPAELGSKPRASVGVESVAVYAVQEHVLSRALIEKLAREHKLLDHYASTDVDW